MPIIGSLPVTLTNGTLEDATQVMADFNYVVSQVNANAAQLVGGNAFTGAQTIAGDAIVTLNAAQTLTNKTLTSPTLNGIGDLTTTGNTILGDATTDTLNVGNGGIIKDASGSVGIGGAPTSRLMIQSNNSATTTPTNISQLTGGIRILGNGVNSCEDGLAFMSAGAGGAAVSFARDGSFGTALKFYTNPTGNAVSGAITLAFLVDQGGSIIPAVTNTINCGSSGTRFGTVFSNLGNFSGLITGSVGANVGNSAQASPTTLDWYEEGTFTPAVTGIGSPTYSVQSGEFQRVGNKVKFRLSLVWTAGTNGGTISSITGLPYSSTAQIHPVTVLMNVNNAGLTWLSGSNVPMGYLNGATAIQVVGLPVAGAASSVSLLNLNAGTKDLYISGEYFV